MKRYFKKLNSNYGFSLVELMVVVAIIGVLASIGIPQYRNFKIKAYQSEAKSHMAGIYTAETSFFTEYSGYHHSLKVIGYGPLGKNRYVAGFRATGVTPANAPTENTVFNTGAICPPPYGTGSDTNCTFVVPIPNITAAPDGIVTATSFTALAQASEESLRLADSSSSPFLNYVLQNFVQSNNANAAYTIYYDYTDVDVWTIDQNKQLKNFKNKNREISRIEWSR